MSDRVEMSCKCKRFRAIKGLNLYCTGTDRPLIFGSREALNFFVEHHCKRVNPFCSYYAERPKCVMERTELNGKSRCGGYNITCNRDTCPHYKSEDDAEIARLKTAQRLMELPKEERRAIRKKYGQKKY